MVEDLVGRIKKLHEEGIARSYLFPEFKENGITKRLVLEKGHEETIFVEKKSKYFYELELKINLDDIKKYKNYSKVLDDYFDPKESASPLPPASPQKVYQKYPSTA